MILDAIKNVLTIAASVVALIVMAWLAAKAAFYVVLLAVVLIGLCVLGAWILDRKP